MQVRQYCSGGLRLILGQTQRLLDVGTQCVEHHVAIQVQALHCVEHRQLLSGAALLIDGS